jgi:predicted DNA-binding protein
MKVNVTPKRFLSVRLTSEELEEVYQLSKTSTCRSLTEYVKKVLTKKPVTVKVRNQSQDDLLGAMIGIKNRLDQLAEHARDKNSETILREIAEVRVLIRESFDKWPS